MQLEIKIVIDFGDDGPPAGDMNDIMRYAAQALPNAFVDFSDARITTHMGWTSSGDDEE